jgi:ribosomal protein S18 acetylase RimI-like enzyme
MKIRPALPSDARTIAGVHVRTWQSAYRGIVPDAHLDALSVDQRERVFREALTRGSPEMWVAHTEPESEAIGWIAFGASRDPDAGASVGEIEAIYVLPSHWSTGAGLALWNVARSRLVERQFQSVTLWVLEDNERAIRFYCAAGFTPDIGARKQVTIEGKNLWEGRYTHLLGLRRSGATTSTTGEPRAQR